MKLSLESAGPQGPTPVVREKTCTCCRRRYDRASWQLLPSVGRSLGVDWRNCSCESTLVAPLAWGWS